MFKGTDLKAFLSGLGLLALWLATLLPGKVLQTNQEQPIYTFSASDNFTHDVRSIAFSPDGKRIAASGISEQLGDNIKVWEIASGKELLAAKTEILSDHISFSSDSSMIAAQYDRTDIRLWDIASGKVLRSVDLAMGFAGEFSFAPGDRALAVADTFSGGSLAFGDPLSGSMQYTPNNVQSFYEIKSISFNPAGELLSTTREKVEWWDVSKAKKIHEMTNPLSSNSIRYYAFSPDGRFLAQVGGKALTPSFAQKAYILDLNSGKVVQKFMVWNVKSVSFAPDGNTLAFGRKGSQGILLYDVAQGRRLKVLHGGEDKTSISFSPDGNLLVTGAIDGEVMLWDVSSIR